MADVRQATCAVLQAFEGLGPDDVQTVLRAVQCLYPVQAVQRSVSGEVIAVARPRASAKPLPKARVCPQRADPAKDAEITDRLLNLLRTQGGSMACGELLKELNLHRTDRAYRRIRERLQSRGIIRYSGTGATSTMHLQEQSP